MSGFFAIHWSPNINPAVVHRVAEQAVTRLRQAYPVGAPPSVTILKEPGFWCAKLDTGGSRSSEVVSDLHDGSWVFVAGPATYANQRTTPQNLLGMLPDLIHDPEIAARRFAGVFAAVAFDGPRRRLMIVPGAMGLFTVYLRRTDDGLTGVSSSLLALAPLGPVTADEFTFRALHRCGHRLPPHTFCKEIRSVPEGSWVELAGGRCETRSYWTPDFSGKAPASIREAAENISQEMSGYCSRLVEPGTAVFSDLTGGYDSRVATACLLHSNIPFVATVAGPDDHPDVVTSHRICAAEDLRLQAVNLVEDPATLADDIRRALLLSEGSTDAFTFAATLRAKQALMRSASPRGIATVSGGLGECYRDFFWAQEFLDRGKRRPASIEKLIRYRLDASQDGMDLFPADWRPEWRDQLRQYAGAIIDPYSGERNTAQLDAVYLRKMAGMMGAFSSAAARFSAPLLPFASAPALEIAFRVPPRWRYNARLLRHMARVLSPELARHRTITGSPCEPMNIANWHRFLPRYVSQGERLVRKVGAVWLGRSFFPEYVERAPAQNPYAALLDTETQPGGHLHWSSMQTGEWYMPRALAQLIRDAREPGGYDLRLRVGRIYTLEAMMRLAQSDDPSTTALAGVVQQTGEPS